MCNTNGTTIGAWKQQLSAVEINYFCCKDLAMLQLFSYSMWRKRNNNSNQCFIFATLSYLKLHNFYVLSFASKLSVIYFKTSSLKCVATWGHKPSRSATDAVGGLSMAFAEIKTKQSGGKHHGYSDNLLVVTHIFLQITATSICLKNGFLVLANLSIK